MCRLWVQSFHCYIYRGFFFSLLQHSISHQNPQINLFINKNSIWLLSNCLFFFFFINYEYWDLINLLFFYYFHWRNYDCWQIQRSCQGRIVCVAELSLLGQFLFFFFYFFHFTRFLVWISTVTSAGDLFLTEKTQVYIKKILLRIYS